MVRPDHRQPRRPRADPDLRAGQAAGGSARRSRYRRRLCRVLRRGGAAGLWRNHSDAAAGCAAAGDPPADRRLRRDHAVEFSVLDDHPQGFAGAGRRLHRGAKPANETPLTALALVALAEKAGVPKGVFNILTGNSSAIGKVLCEHPAVRFVGFTGSTEVGKILYPAGRGRGEEARARTRRQRAVRGVRRCRYRCRGRRRHGLEIPQHGPDLRLRQPPLRPGQDLRPVRREALEESRRDEDRRRHRSTA